MQRLSSGGDVDQDTISDAEKQTLIDREIRIQQSVEIQKVVPSTILGCLFLGVVLFLYDPDLILSSGAFAANFLTVIMLTLMLRSYVRLRHKPRPKDVSQRRIRAINIATFLNGFSWALFSVLALRLADPITAVIIVLGTTSFAIACLVVVTSLPVAGAITALSVIFANGIATAVYGHLPIWFSVLFTSALATTAISCVVANWEKTKLNVTAQVENALAEAERAKEKELLSRRLAKYLSPQLFDAILTGDQTDEIIAQRKKLTIFFSDIVGFTEITDRLESEELSALLNRYLTEMSAIAEAHGGTLDKFIGDAVVVYFGDPETKGLKEDAAACVRMAIAMQNRVHALKQEWLDLGLDDTFELRVGINTGYCTVGNFGSDIRMDYTIIGGEVNLAARLEAASEVGGILLANETYALVKDWVTADEGEPLTVKGFSRPVRTFKLRSVDGIDTPEGEGEGFRHSAPHLSITMNTGRMSDAQRRQSVAVLQEALKDIEGQGAG